jgi:hypothetical protein
MTISEDDKASLQKQWVASGRGAEIFLRGYRKM